MRDESMDDALVAGDALLDIPALSIATWAAAAGYESEDDQRKFRTNLEWAYGAYLRAVAIPPAAQWREELQPVVDAAKIFQEALDGLNDAVRGIMVTDYQWPHIRPFGRLHISDLSEIVRRVGVVADELKKFDTKLMPGQPIERTGKRGRHVKNLACAIVRAYAHKRGGFYLGERMKAKGSPYLYHSVEFVWLGEILDALISGIKASEINEAAAFAKRNYDSWAKIAAIEDAGRIVAKPAGRDD